MPQRERARRPQVDGQRGRQSGLVPRMLRINGQIRFRPQDVREWLEAKEIK